MESVPVVLKTFMFTMLVHELWNHEVSSSKQEIQALKMLKVDSLIYPVESFMSSRNAGTIFIIFAGIIPAK